MRQLRLRPTSSWSCLVINRKSLNQPRNFTKESRWFPTGRKVNNTALDAHHEARLQSVRLRKSLRFHFTCLDIGHLQTAYPRVYFQCSLYTILYPLLLNHSSTVYLPRLRQARDHVFFITMIRRYISTRPNCAWRTEQILAQKESRTSEG